MSRCCITSIMALGLCIFSATTSSAQTETNFVSEYPSFEAAGMVEELADIADSWIATQSHVFGKPVIPAKEFAAVIKSVDINALIHIEENVHEALDYSIGKLKPDDLLIVTGSIYMLGEARDYWIPRDNILMQLESDNPVYSNNINTDK